MPSIARLIRVSDLLASQDWTVVRYLSPLALGWLAFFFGRTLRAGSTPLIEQIARRSSADLTAPLRRYARMLTAVWCGYFVVAATLSATVGGLDGATFDRIGFAVLVGSVLLFVGEHRLRPRIFPQETFPGLLQQLRDTWNIWRAPGGAGPEIRR